MWQSVGRAMKSGGGEAMFKVAPRVSTYSDFIYVRVALEKTANNVQFLAILSYNKGFVLLIYLKEKCFA
jgi:hypothetical protein